MDGYKQNSARAQDTISTSPFHTTNFPDGTAWTKFYRTSAGYLLRFPQLADFEVSANGRLISCWPVPGTTESTVEHLYLNQVLPLALSKFGKFVFHASAVEIGLGAIAFLAEAGRGKSTLAAAFATSGLRFLTDDGLVLVPDGSDFLAQPSHPSIRLWQDSRSHLALDATEAPSINYSPKVRLLAGPGLNFCPDTRPLRAVYCLGARPKSAVEFKRLRPAESLISWAKHAFVLDIEDRELIAAHFERLTELANSVPCFHLDYPRRFGDLPHVVDEVAAHAIALDGH